VFRKRPATEVKHVWTGDALPALLFDALSGVTLLAGLVRVARARPGGALLAISLVLSAFGALFGLAA
jgi:hypothetical protein